MTGFQTLMQTFPAVGIEGDWCSANPRFSLLSGDGKLRAGPSGVTAGRFAWARDDGIVDVGGNGRIGFVHRDQVALIPFNMAASGGLAQSTMLVVPNGEITLYTSCDVWCKFAAGAKVGQKVYAKYSDGTAVAAATGSPTTSSTTSFSIAATTTMSVTGSIQNGILTVTTLGAGHVYPGSIIAGTIGSVTIPTGCQVQLQLPQVGSETLGGVGRYLLAYDDGISTASGTITGSIGILTVNATVTGTFSIGDVLSASDVTSGTQLWADSTNGYGLTGAGTTGTYAVSPSQAASTGTLTAATNVETNWYVDTYAASGELAKISTRG